MRLRWNICKALKISFDDPLFERLSAIQILSYAYLLQQDKIEEEEAWRDRIEYLARFWDNDAVEKVQESRRRAKEAPDAAFNETLKHMFGRGIGSGVQLPVKSIQQLGQDIEKAST